MAGGREAGADEPEILFARRGAVGLVTLNRPRALNALSLAMIAAMHAQLRAWASDDAVTRVVLRGTGGRAFCAGGDVRALYALAKSGRHAEVDAFWHGEYGLDAFVQAYPKPIVSLIDGLCMGGGNGLSLHGSHRVASEGYRFAMPEVGIGFFPDVGMTYALPRLPGRTGTYLALAGATIGPGDALALGLATHHAPAGRFDAIVADLAEGGDIDAALTEHAETPPPPGPVMAERALIDACFAEPGVADILARLDGAAARGSGFAAETAALMRTRSPTSLCIAHAQMRRGPAMTFAQAIAAETRLAAWLMDGHDFFEGVRAALIDKDGAPAWRPATLDAVDHDAIAAIFETPFAASGGPAPRSGT
ncbi:enoyl-CoA hydratase/isomerase family protein [Methylobacterium sp. J-090]|uniref:enoyl-CoA hydratase/isomerase family protein n=1 Tax=Methylobacterium sp. J-090 TaxID=2836666 RepID=UPI001FB9AA6E|nr:enoyl-CoA hydratase/isomerase family protein [Methylobacterium sp. J-090]MCJ2081108.1 enoyl-CoA hydratase/isomerase family protein [Methylobacterium sp. J-090]